jgi:DnaK suppressor protein
MTKRTTQLRKINELLQRRRRLVTASSTHAHEELRALKEQERDPEYEEGAQAELADYTLSHLIENARRELLLIDAALQRMAEGTFGTCVDCGTEISYERLEALPFAIRCEEDARRHERELHGEHYSAPSL